MTIKLLGKKMLFDRDTGFLKKTGVFCFLSAISQRIFLNNISFERAEKTDQNAILVMYRI